MQQIHFKKLSAGVGSEHNNIAVTKEGENFTSRKYLPKFLGIFWDILDVYDSHDLGESSPFLYFS